VYEDVLIALADANVRFAVTGGAAVALHGVSRPVADLDIVVEPGSENLDAVTTCMTTLGFWPTLPLPISAVIVMRMLDSSGREVDINRVYPMAFAALVGRATFVSLSGRPIAVVSKPDLITIKRQRGRDYDLDDVRLLEDISHTPRLGS
jgi:hypothetical protein